MVSPLAASAYTKLARLADPSGGLKAGIGKAAGGDSNGGSFGAMVKDATAPVVQPGKTSGRARAEHGRRQSQYRRCGHGGQPKPKWRSRRWSRCATSVIQAYEEIMKMPI